MIEALWSVEFSTNLGMYGFGVAVFETKRILGGDSGMTYVGSYEVDHNNTIHCKIHVQKYADIPDMNSSLGLDDFNLEVTGKVTHEEMNLSGHVVEDTSRQINIHAIRRAELP